MGPELEATHLDLSGCTEIETLRGLAALSVSSLDISGTGLRGLDGVEGVPLRELVARGCTRLADLGALAGASELRAIDATECERVRDLAPLAGCPALESVVLTGSKLVHGLAPLADLPVLRVLDATKTAVTGLGDVGAMGALRELRVGGCDVGDALADLAGSGIERLDVSGVHQAPSLLPDLSTLRSLTWNDARHRAEAAGIERFPSLTQLSLVGTWLTDLLALEPLSELEDLDLSGCRDLESARGLSSLGALRRFKATNNKDCDFDGLFSCANLRDLELRRCESLIRPNGVLEELVHIHLSKLEIESLEFVGSVANLVSLKLFGCPNLASLDPIADAPVLRELDVGSCQGLASMAPLARLPALRELAIDPEAMLLPGFPTSLPTVQELSCGEVKSPKGLDAHGSVETLRLWFSQLTSFEELGSMPSLRRLILDWSKELTNLRGIEAASGLVALEGAGLKAVEDLSALASLPHLETLKLGAIAQATLDTLPSLPALRALVLGPDYAVDDLSALRRQPALTALELTACKAPGAPATRHTRAGVLRLLDTAPPEPAPRPEYRILGLDIPGFWFSHEYFLDTSQGNVFANFGFYPEIATDGSGHAHIMSRVLPGGQKDYFIAWDEELSAGITFSRPRSTWLSAWAMTFRDQTRPALGDHLGRLLAYAEEVGDEAFPRVADALLADLPPADVWALIDPEGPMTRFEAARRDHPTTETDAWWQVVQADRTYNTPLRYLLEQGVEEPRFRQELFRRRLKYDLGSDPLRLLSKAAKGLPPDGPYGPAVRAPDDPDGWRDVGARLATAGDRDAAAAAYENALWIGGRDAWPEVYAALLDLFADGTDPAYRRFLEGV